jgi:hypothetical protein
MPGKGCGVVVPSPNYSEEHVWVAAATVGLSLKQARHALLRHSVRLPKQIRIDVLDIYCDQCRRTFDDVCDEPCIAATTAEHLRGGPIGERKKRAHHKHNCELLGCDPSGGSVADAG